MTVSSPVWEIAIEKQSQQETWSNVYYGQFANKADAIALGQEIAGIEATIHNQDVFITRIRVRDSHETGYNGTLTDVSYQGQRGNETDMPLFVCARVVFNQVQGRPSVKYLRGVVTAEDIQDRTNFKPAFLAFMATTYEAPMAALVGLVGNDGLPFESIHTSHKTAEHQLRRGSKRKPVLG